MYRRSYNLQRLGLSLLFITLVGVIPAIAQQVGTDEASRKLTPLSINLSWVPTTANQLPFFLAKTRGYFAAEGMDVTLVPGKGSALTAQTVGAGRYEIGQADLTTMAIARSQGGPVKAFFVQFPRTSFGCVGAKDAGIESWKDLYAKNVGVTQGAPETYLLPATFKKLGLDLSRVQRINVPAANKSTSYMSKLVDALCSDVASELPLLAPRRPSNVLWFGEALDVPYQGLFAREDFIRSKPDLIRGVAAAVAKATKEMASDPNAVEASAVALAQVNPPGVLDPANMIAAWKLYAPFERSPLTQGHPVGWMSQLGWQRTLELLVEYADFRGSTNPDDYFTNEFVPN